ncbi:MAG: oxygen-independent coproporphyrinogen III oxidase [Mesorhizobium amorphae]|nr:MAG: oxygen-independent coproporphyrinogen III oxidase [Mesorhizobium amorphae]
MTIELIRRFTAPVPRYTSYPTAPHFHAGVDAGTYAGWLAAIGAEDTLSLYIHVPFCDRLCWFCGCHTKQTLRYEPVAAYCRALEAEIATVSRHLGGRGRVVALHFGGGSPTMLRPDDIARLGEALHEGFRFAPDAEISLEIDPSDMDAPRLDAWADFGVTRASFGVQDFDARVQAAINREQSFGQTRDAVEGFRARGVSSINLDVLYGLPHQTEASLSATIAQVVALAPSRVALFGYAHVPWMKPHQRLIPDDALPDSEARFHQAGLSARLLVEAGFTAIGMDHFAHPDDPLARAAAAGNLHRNFQGYTTDEADALIGLGASSIGRLPQGYIQNTVPTGEYSRSVLQGELPVARGFALGEEDRALAQVIESLMCDFAFDLEEIAARFPEQAARVADLAARASTGECASLVTWDGQRFTIHAPARPLVRTVAACFDAYLGQGPGRHSAAV